MPTNYNTVVLATAGLVNFYETNEASGSTAPDSVGTNTGALNSGVTKGATGLTAGGGTDYAFGAANSGVTSSTPFVPGGSSVFSVEWLMKPSARPSVMGWCQVGPNDKASGGFVVWGDDSTAPSITVNGSVRISGGSPISIGTVYHVVVTYDGTNWRLYINATQRYASPPSDPAPVFTSGFKFGGGIPGFGPNTLTYSQFVGTMGKLAFYNVALSSSTVTNHYNNIPTDTTGSILDTGMSGGFARKAAAMLGGFSAFRRIFDLNPQGIYVPQGA